MHDEQDHELETADSIQYTDVGGGYIIKVLRDSRMSLETSAVRTVQSNDILQAKCS